MTTRVRTADLQATLDRLLTSDARLASGTNGQLSKAEQAAAPSYVAAAAAQIRADDGSGTRVRDERLSKYLSSQGRGLIASVNQPTGVGRAYFSRAEATAARAADPLLGARVEKAWAITGGRVADTDGIAEARVRASMSDGVFQAFSSESTAENHRDPWNRSVSWLVKTGETADHSSYVSGRNDLWSQRFDVDAQTGAITVTGEH